MFWRDLLAVIVFGVSAAALFISDAGGLARAPWTLQDFGTFGVALSWGYVLGRPGLIFGGHSHG